jgi:hypothetical protein
MQVCLNLPQNYKDLQSKFWAAYNDHLEQIL